MLFVIVIVNNFVKNFKFVWLLLDVGWVLREVDFGMEFRVYYVY